MPETKQVTGGEVFKKTPEEKAALKKAKSQWKKANPIKKK
jgi:hypothetical protein